MKVLLVQPPIEDFYDTAIRTYPLSLLYLATKIRDICDLSIIDFRSNKKPKVIHNHPFPELKNYYREDIHTPFSFFSRFYRFGCNHEEIKKNIREQKPDVVGISSLFTTYAIEAIEVARCVKGVSKDITTIMGGIHPTLFPSIKKSLCGLRNKRRRRNALFSTDNFFKIRYHKRCLQNKGGLFKKGGWLQHFRYKYRKQY
jgi:hypothetical protein